MSIHKKTRQRLEELLTMLIYSDRFGCGPIDETDVATICHDLHHMSNNELLNLASDDISRIFQGDWPYLGDPQAFAEEYITVFHNARVERDIYWLLV